MEDMMIPVVVMIRWYGEEDKMLRLQYIILVSYKAIQCERIRLILMNNAR